MWKFVYSYRDRSVETLISHRLLQISSERQIIILGHKNRLTSVARIVLRPVSNVASDESALDIVHLICDHPLDFVQIFQTVIRVILEKVTGTHSSTDEKTFGIQRGKICWRSRKNVLYRSINYRPSFWEMTHAVFSSPTDLTSLPLDHYIGGTYSVRY